MPNWCDNAVTLTHKDPAMIKRAFSALIHGRLLEEFFPCPQDLRDTVSGFVEEEKQSAHESQRRRNLELYGFGDWYDWCVSNWGVKWDVGGDLSQITQLDELSLEALFNSAWAPPCKAYEKLIELGFSIKAFYNEPGMAFCGVWQGDRENGFSDDYCQYGGETSETVRQVIGEELDDFWGISKNMASYDEEASALDEENYLQQIGPHTD